MRLGAVVNVFACRDMDAKFKFTLAWVLPMLFA